MKGDTNPLLSLFLLSLIQIYYLIFTFLVYLLKKPDSTALAGNIVYIPVTTSWYATSLTSE